MALLPSSKIAQYLLNKRILRRNVLWIPPFTVNSEIVVNTT